MWKAVEKLKDFLDGKARRQFALLFLPMLFAALLEMVSIGLILPVIQVALQGEATGRFAQLIASIFPSAGTTGITASWIAGLFASFFVVKNIVLLGVVHLVNVTIENRKADFLRRMYRVYLGRPLSFHYRNNSALILRNLNSGCGHSFECVRGILLIFMEGLLITGAASLLLFVQPVVTLATAATLGIVAISYHKLAGPIFTRWGKRAMALDGELIKWINQSLTSIRDVKLTHAYDYMDRSIADPVRDRAQITARVSTTVQLPRFMIETVIVVGFIVLLLLLLAVEQNPADIVGMLGLFGMAALRLMPSLNRILSVASDLLHRAAYIDGLHKDLIDSMEDRDWKAIGSQANGAPITFEDAIDLTDVCFIYEDAARHALDGINLKLKKSESVGIVGPSGAGKSTLVDIILGLSRPDSGTVTVDGTDIFDCLPGWQRQIGCVPQQISLIDDTLRRNIAFAQDDADIDEARLANVLTLARLDEVVATLPHGLDTLVGEHGVRLSGGQRQRIAIGRALYREPSVLVFDEATSALDNETEREITRAIDNLSGENTVVVIAHRLSTVRNCDKIVFMLDGRIADVGSFDELLARNATFQRFAEFGGDGTPMAFGAAVAG